jgi:hypothetical protein
LEKKPKRPCLTARAFSFCAPPACGRHTFVDLRPVPVYAVTGSTRHRLPKIKACLDYWQDWFAR